MLVELRDVSKRFGDRLAVDRLNLSVPEGACFGLLGPNGAGMTTALRMVYGVTQPTSGSVTVFGLDVSREARAVRQRLGVTMQENVFIDVLSPTENLRVFGRYHLLSERELTARIDELLDFLELRSHASVPVKFLSGGFKRRLAIAMSLLNRPELLILDEPTTGLDPAVRLLLWSRVRALRANGTTILLTTHYMDEAERLCDHIAIVAAGRIVAEGAPAALIREHLAPDAIEVEAHGEALPTAGVRREVRVGDRAFLYADDAAPVVEALRRTGGERRPLVVRPTNLEDVFLLLTGTNMGEGA